MYLRLIAATTALLIASPAVAKPDLDCLWDQLTIEQQNSRIPAQPTGELAPPIDGLSEQQLLAMQTRCGLDLETRAEWLTSLDMLGVERGIVSWLGRNAGLSPSRVETLWNGIPEADRTFVLKTSRDAIGGTDNRIDNDRVDQIAVQAAANLGLAVDSDAYNVAATFVKVRGLRLALIDMTPK